MDWQFSANASFFGLQRNRFTEYQPGRTIEEKLTLIARVDGLTGAELKYPFDFDDVALVRSLLERHGLALSAVNVDTKDATHFRYGALSAGSTRARERAVTLLREAMDVAADLGANLVTTCPLADGYDYAFQVDHTAAWQRLVETVRAAAGHRSDVRLCLEYQPHEPHAHVLLGNVGAMLHVCAEVGAPNLGANLDVGHSFAAGESPAEAAALLALKGRLFYVHTNDNTGDGGDWDMISGSVHFWHWLEFLYTLHQVGYDGWLGGDLLAKHTEPVAVYGANTRMVQRMIGLLRRIGVDEIAALVEEEGNVAETFDRLSSFLVPEGG
jgi:xylose isomerase